MSIRRSNDIKPKVVRTSSIPSKTPTNNQLTKKFQKSNVVPPRKAKKEQQMKNNTQDIKLDYKSSNFFYNDNHTNNDKEIYTAHYYDRNQKNQSYNRETNESYMEVEQEDGNIKIVPKNYIEYNNNRNTPYVYNNQNYEYYDENRDEYENESDEGIDNDEMYYENEEEYEQDDVEEQQSPKNNYNQYPKVNKYYMTQNNNGNNSNNNIIKKVNQNVISGQIHHQVNYPAQDIKRKTRASGAMHNYGNNATTTNNTYNNNIYYINQNPNPVNVKNNMKKEDNQKSKRVTKNKNSVYKNVDITINKRRLNKEKDYFKSHNIDKSQRSKYIDSAILIQSLVRTYLVKMKIFNNINLYVRIKKGTEILEEYILKQKKYFWKIYKNYLAKIERLSYNILKQYLKTNHRNNSTDKKFASFHKELGDSFNIINKRDTSEKKLKSKLNDVIKENTELKNQLVDNKNIEEKMKNLIDENKKNQNINAIIMKDNQQLAKKLKDFQDYRNTNLIVQNQNSLDLTQKELSEIDELIKSKDICLKKLKLICLAKIIYKKINHNKYLMKDKFDKYKIIVEKIKNEDKQKEFKKQIYLKNLVQIINNRIKLTKLSIFKKIYYTTAILNKEKQSKDDLKTELLKNIFIKSEENRKKILLKSFIKIYYNNKSQDKKKPEKTKEEIRFEYLKKIYNKYNINRRCILKSFIEKWMLRSKILGMRAAARDKKKKRKLKKKNNKLISQKHFGLVDKSQEKNNNNLNNKFCKSIHEFSYIVSNGTVIKESSSNEPTEINIKNNKCSISSDKINKLKKFDKNVGLKKINSVNEINIQNNIKKESKDISNKEKTNSNVEESDEDSGDSLGLGNNSD